MPPGGGGGDNGCTVPGHPPATGRLGRAEDAPPHPPPPPPFSATDVSLEMKKKQKQEDEQEQQPLGSLPEGPLVDILSRVPYRSLCRFKCVSKPWLALCSDPKLRKRCPQTLSGFFFNKSKCGLSFRNLSGKGAPMVDPSLPFLGGKYERVEVEQSCGGLLLCKYWESYKGRNKKKYGYAVCNPATGQWSVLTLIVLPDPVDGVPVIYDDIDDFFLAFDAANPSRFAVFAPLSNSFGEFAQVAIFSSDTRRWTSVENEWGYKNVLIGKPECALLNGTMHFGTHYGTIVTVDMEGKVWGEFDMPDDRPDKHNYTSIGQSQGCLYAWQIDNDNDCKLCVWVLQDYATGKWTLKHTANVSEIFGRQLDEDDHSYTLFAIHPDCNMVFLTDSENMTLSYDMDNQKVSAISTSRTEFVDGALYVPCFAEWLAEGH
ncbi:F-box protein At5g49610 [Lolium perenne]|uniref:F-box protein At5g49610 n=1 Tax=Lolium perenne TaxID=4522 RepID=UPI0021F5C784|nr:F-box protein At5g07610-like [Lolium perenne]